MASNKHRTSPQKTMSRGFYRSSDSLHSKSEQIIKNEDQARKTEKVR